MPRAWLISRCVQLCSCAQTNTENSHSSRALRSDKPIFVFLLTTTFRSIWRNSLYICFQLQLQLRLRLNWSIYCLTSGYSAMAINQSACAQRLPLRIVRVPFFSFSLAFCRFLFLLFSIWFAAMQREWIPWMKTKDHNHYNSFICLTLRVFSDFILFVSCSLFSSDSRMAYL